MITFATNTGAGSLEYTKLLLKSLKENLKSKEHEILIFIDSDTDGTYEYLKSVKSEFTDLKIIRHKVKPVIGYQLNSNIIVEYAKYDIISYLQNDMIVSKNYDVGVLEDLEENCILSSTRIEPPLHGQSPITFTKDFGLMPEEFKWDEFVEFADTVKSDRVENYFFAPYTFHRKTWQSIGGYDSRFRRAREDSDFVQRCVQKGIKLKQTFKSNVYHFTCVSSRGKNWFDKNNKEAQERVELQKIADNIELQRFFRKWGTFNHGETILKKLDTDLVLKGNAISNLPFVAWLEPFFSRVWVESDKYKDDIILFYKDEHTPANKLLAFSDEDWKTAKHIFNTTNYSEIYKVGTPTDYNIKVEIEFTNVKDNDEFLMNIHNITSMFIDTEAGVYELGCAKITINKIVVISDSYTTVTNPPFDKNLLEIE
jgi:GT2 family glycosyltransferase